jgi:hypothetical protein
MIKRDPKLRRAYEQVLHHQRQRQRQVSQFVSQGVS